MANRDRGQGFGFMYVDIAQVLASRDEIAKQAKNNSPFSTQSTPTVNFNKDSDLSSKSGTRSSEKFATHSLPTPAVQERKQAIHQIRENLDRLQSLHHKLHAMLEELNSITDKKKS